MDISKLLGGIGNSVENAVQGIGNFVGNEVKQFSPAVQNFTQQAGQLLGKSGQVGFNNPLPQLQIGNPLQTPQTPLFVQQQQGQQPQSALTQSLLANRPPEPTPSPTNFGGTLPNQASPLPSNPPPTDPQSLLNSTIGLLEQSAQALVQGIRNGIPAMANMTNPGNDWISRFVTGENSVPAIQDFARGLNNPLGETRQDPNGKTHLFDPYAVGQNVTMAFPQAGEAATEGKAGFNMARGLVGGAIGAGVPLATSLIAGQKPDLGNIAMGAGAGFVLGAPGESELNPTGLSKTLVKDSGLGSEEMKVFNKMQSSGIKSLSTQEMDILKGINMGKMQEMSQQSKGLGLLAKYDQASHAQDTTAMQQIAQEVMAQPKGSPYDAYKATFEQLASPSGIAGKTGKIAYPDYEVHGKDILSPDGQKALLGKVQQAATNQPQFHQALENTALDINGRAISNIKSPTSMISKVIEHRKTGEQYDIHSLGDTLRGSVVMPNEKTLPQTLATIKDEVQQQGWTIDKEQNFFEKPGPNDYTGYQVDVTMPDGQKGEIQIHTPESYANARLTHDAYGQFGDKVPAPVAKQVDRLQAKIKTDPVARTEQMVRGKEMQDLPNTLSPMESDFSQQSLQSPKLTELLQAKSSLQSELQEAKKVPDQVTAIQQEQQRLQGQLAATQNIPKNVDPNTRLALKSQKQDLKQQYDNLTAQLNDLHGNYQLQVKDKSDRITASTKDLDKQIQEEQSRLQAQNVTQQPLEVRTAKQNAFAQGISVKQAQTNMRREAGLPALRTATDLQGAGMTKTPQKYFEPTTGLSSVIQSVMKPLIQTVKGAKDVRAQQIGFGVQDAENWYQHNMSGAKTLLENARNKLSPEDYQNATRSLEGKETPNNANVANWVNVAQGITKDIADKAKTGGVMVKDANGKMKPFQELDNYFPHWRTQQQLDSLLHNTDYLKQVIDSGKATDENSARAYVMNNRSRVISSKFGSLESHRDLDSKIPYIEDPRVLEDYVDGAYHRIAYNSVFGNNMGTANKMIADMRKGGNAFDANNVQELLHRMGATYGTEISPEETALRNWIQTVRNTEAVTKQGILTPLHHITSLPQMTSRLGIGNVAKATPALVKGIFGNYSDEARSAIPSMHGFENSQLYGRAGNFMNKFYSGIGLNRTLNSLRAMGHDAATSRIGELENDLQSQKSARDIQQAGLDYQAIAQRGHFTPVEKTAYINAALKDSSLFLSPEDMPKFYSTTVGKLAGMFQGPSIQKTFRFMPYILNEVKSGNIAPALGFALLAPLAGSAVQEGQNLITNKPPAPIGKTLLEGSIRGVLPTFGEEIANAIQYGGESPAIAASSLAGAFGGPLASDAVTASTVANQLLSKNQNDQLTGQRTLVRNIPIAGPILPNNVLPYKSYVGNRPGDTLQAIVKGQDITHNPGPFQYTTKPSVADMFRQNPIVQQQNQLTQNILGAKTQLMNQLNPEQQTAWSNISNLLQGQYNGNGNKLSSIQAYSQMANDPQVAQAYSQYEVYSAQQSGKPVNPLYALGVADPAAQRIVLQYKGLLPAQQAAFKSDPNNLHVLNAYNAAEADYYAKIPQSQQAQQSGIQPPVPSSDVKKLLDNYAQSKTTGKPNYSYIDDPRTQAYFKQLDYYDNYVNGLAGLPATSGGTKSGSSSGYGSSSSESYLTRQMLYQAMSDAKARINIPKMQTGAENRQLQALVKQNPNMLRLGETGSKNSNKTIFDVPKQFQQNLQASMPKLQRVNITKGLGRIDMKQVSNYPKESASPGRMQKLTIK